MLRGVGGEFYCISSSGKIQKLLAARKSSIIKQTIRTSCEFYIININVDLRYIFIMNIYTIRKEFLKQGYVHFEYFML